MKQANNEGKVLKILRSEVTSVVAIAVALIGIYSFFNDADTVSEKEILILQEEVNTIKTNDLVHIQAAIDEVKEDQKELEKLNRENHNKILDRMDSILEELRVHDTR